MSKLDKPERPEWLTRRIRAAAVQQQCKPTRSTKEAARHVPPANRGGPK